MASTEKKRLSLPTGVVPSKHFQGLLMTSFALPERPRSRRAKYPKVRTGCISCKKRHVKCDEAKPSCNRCLKWSGVCGGYEPPRAKSCPPKSTAASRAAGAKSPCSRPRTVCEPPSPAIPTLDESVVTPSVAGSEPATPPFLQVYQPLDYFSDHNDGYSSGGSSVGTVNAAMPVMSSPGASSVSNVGEIGILDATFWTDTVPRLVRENLAVRYANMAVHILILSKQPELIIQESPDLGTDHYSLALAHYGLALKQMRHSSEIFSSLRIRDVNFNRCLIIFHLLNNHLQYHTIIAFTLAILLLNLQFCVKLLNLIHVFSILLQSVDQRLQDAQDSTLRLGIAAAALILIAGLGLRFDGRQTHELAIQLCLVGENELLVEVIIDRSDVRENGHGELW
ncbi:hypothetical protein NLG97_g6907 [Lecanicillium saksenae]|uniref:Uncharacterized protein n=1 Tax=Lecanicillium saksenae TaxID=468837 RepID=A0ACC1QNB3_9HYPO|nr:hypothetical protein NLG97_g6907 [Lecanicillium saksenae]